MAEHSQDNERAIMEQARDDPAGFAPLYEQYFPGIYRYCIRRVGSREEAEDLTSLIFTRALAGLNSYRGGPVAAWLFTIAHNAVANHYRDRRATASLDDPARPFDGEEPGIGDNTLARIVDEEEGARVAGLIAGLPEEQRNLLSLRIAGGLSAKEIGAVLGKSESAVRVAIHRTIQELRTAYWQGELESGNERP